MKLTKSETLVFSAAVVFLAGIAILWISFFHGLLYWQMTLINAIRWKMKFA